MLTQWFDLGLFFFSKDDHVKTNNGSWYLLFPPGTFCFPLPMNIDYFENLDRIASDMNQAQVVSDATVGYDVLSDALVWSDEYPHNITGRLDEFDCVKLLLRYRTTLLFGEPDADLKPYWEYAKERFPNWAGFCLVRSTRTEKLWTHYERDRKSAMRRVERFERLEMENSAIQR